MDDLNFIELPCGSDRDNAKVVIAVDQIASMRSHTVVSYSYQEWTEITLKNGKAHDCRATLDEVKRLVQRATA